MLIFCIVWKFENISCYKQMIKNLSSFYFVSCGRMYFKYTFHYEMSQKHHFTIVNFTTLSHKVFVLF
jgi:hypothetical protein